MPKQGLASTFRFGFATGGLIGVLVGLEIPVSYVLPRIWQQHAGIGPAPDAAHQLLPAPTPLPAPHKDTAAPAAPRLPGRAIRQLLKVQQVISEIPEISALKSDFHIFLSL